MSEESSYCPKCGKAVAQGTVYCPNCGALVTLQLQPSPYIPSKPTVGRTRVIAIGIICIVLVVGLVGTVAYYTSIISGRDNTITDLTNTVNLTKYTVWISSQTITQAAGYYTYWTNGFSASYAGYVSVNVITSTTTNTYVEVIYSSHGVTYDNQIVVGTSGTATFPILPSSSINIRIGNTNSLSSATETVTITHYY